MSRQAKGNLIALAGIIILLILTVIAARSAGIAYNGLVYGEMGTIVNDMKARGQNVALYWHDQEKSTCPNFLTGPRVRNAGPWRVATMCATITR